MSRVVMTLLSTSLVAGVMTAAILVGSATTASAAPLCTVGGQSVLLQGVTANSTVPVSCSGLPPGDTAAILEASPLAGISGVNEEDEVDIGTLKTAAVTAGGQLTGQPINFSIP
ncbi:MAG TPA: hypothetical protein VEJ87_10545, partial [Acidimicrobiales bacterium]|nr:hypothetical protein [Acidimicrobiales bacterium]